MATVLLTGATGVLGRALQRELADAGHQVRKTSRTPSTDDPSWVALDLAAGMGIEEAVAEVNLVVHAASDARGDPEATDVQGTRRLVAAAAAAGVEHVLYVSIVGVDRIPYSYYQHNLAAEEHVAAGDVPWTTVRATQFFPFVAYLLSRVVRLPVWPLPATFVLQPIDHVEAAAAIVAQLEQGPAETIIDVGGPEVHTVRELAEAYRSTLGVRRPIVNLPLPGKVARAFRTGHATCPERAIGERTWEAWLAEQNGIPGVDAY